jgi:hypothetical protein
MNYTLDKQIWTDSDFEQMGWHDSTIYRMRLDEDLVFDIDYILKWNKPDLEGLPFTFWIAPATLVFKAVQNLTFEFDFGFNQFIEIDDIERGENANHWVIITQQGDIQFKAEGYCQFIRQQPSFEFGQTISYIERGGYSVERTINQENPNRSREDVLKNREKDLQNYEMVKKRHLKKQELEQLIKSSDHKEIDIKEFLIKRKEMKDSIYSYNSFLKDTRFENW